MKLTTTCPKCQNTEIIKIPGQIGMGDPHNGIPISGGWLPKSVGITRYLCANCGYSEEWVDTKDEIQTVKDRYLKPQKSEQTATEIE